MVRLGDLNPVGRNLARFESLAVDAGPATEFSVRDLAVIAAAVVQRKNAAVQCQDNSRFRRRYVGVVQAVIRPGGKTIGGISADELRLRLE